MPARLAAAASAAPSAFSSSVLSCPPPRQVARALSSAPGEERVEALGQPLFFRPGRQIFGEGEAAASYYRVAQGAVRACKVMPDGRRHVTNFFFKGDLLGFSGRGHFHFTAEAIGEVTLLRYPRLDLASLLAARPALAQRLLAAMEAELRAAQDQLLLLGRKTAPERVASFLLMVAGRCALEGKPGQAELPMKRSDIADYLGLTIETVSRVLCRFKADGLIDLPSPSRVIFRRLDLLRVLRGDEAGGQH